MYAAARRSVHAKISFEFATTGASSKSRRPRPCAGALSLITRSMHAAYNTAYSGGKRKWLIYCRKRNTETSNISIDGEYNKTQYYVSAVVDRGRAIVVNYRRGVYADVANVYVRHEPKPRGGYVLRNTTGSVPGCRRSEARGDGSKSNFCL